MQEVSQAIEKGRLGRYELLGELGRGAMGVVYRARDPIIDRVVALKTIDSGRSGEAAASFTERFFQEARSAGRLNHPNIVTIYDAGDAGGQAYIAMEFLEGTGLREMLDEQAPLSIARAVEIAAQVARGLAYAHEHGVVHRDVKPANIIILRNRRPKITDFGIARLGEADVLTGSRAGSPKYMSPEQIRGDGALDGRSDIFSLGAVLYEMLTGRQPFGGAEVVDIMRTVLQDHPQPPSAHNARVPPELDALVLRMLAKRPDERHPSARWLYRELRQVEETLEKEPSGPAPRADAPTRKVSLEDPTLVMGDEHPAPAAAPQPGPMKRYGGRLAAAAAVLIAAAVVVLAPWRESPSPPAPQAAVPIIAVAPPTAEEPPEPQSPPPAAAPEKLPEPAPPPKAKPRAAKKPPEPAPVAVPEPAPPPVEVVVAPPPKPAPPPPPQTGKIVLAVSPWGEVYVDGRLRGTTPPLAELELPPGRHRVEIRNSAQLPYHAFVELQAGQTQPIRHSFPN
ncbi:MAG TPA: serine/threonine-protein kinase [Burkholderiales bacterium]|nr:serine/threonine-protein kinase [Burkholderiales bacterium]